MKYVIEDTPGIYEVGINPDSEYDDCVVIFLRKKEQFASTLFSDAFQSVKISDLIEMLRWLESWGEKK